MVSDMPSDAAADALDELLIDHLEEDFLSVLLTPPRVPAFSAPTVRPPARCES